MQGQKKEYRRSIMLPEDMEKYIVRMRLDERFTRMSYAEIIRMLIQAGIKSLESDSLEPESRPA